MCVCVITRAGGAGGAVWCLAHLGGGSSSRGVSVGVLRDDDSFYLSFLSFSFSLFPALSLDFRRLFCCLFYAGWEGAAADFRGGKQPVLDCANTPHMERSFLTPHTQATTPGRGGFTPE